MIPTSGVAPKSFIVEGNIGAGKSTFLKIIQKHLDVQVVFEPHEKWQKVIDGQNLLDKFYKILHDGLIHFSHMHL